MTDQLTALRELVAKVEAGTAIYDDFHALCQVLVGYHGRAHEAFADGSLDAAQALHEALLPKWRVQEIAQDYRPLAKPWLVHLAPPSGHRNIPRWANAENPARAWLVAILKAKIAELEATQ